MPRVLVILGTNRDDSNTRKALKQHLSYSDWELVELAKLNIRHYVYGTPKPADDFLGVVDKMLEAEVLVFATPVYWYAMSALMKTFFDRFSDLITTEKTKGRALAGRSACTFVTGYDEQLPEGFEVPFRRTSEYFDMNYLGTSYHSVRN